MDDGDRVILAIAFTFALGIWVGVLLVPPEAVSLPVSEGEYGNLRKVVYPLGTGHLIVQVLAVGTALWYVFGGTDPDAELEEVDRDV